MKKKIDDNYEFIWRFFRIVIFFVSVYLPLFSIVSIVSLMSFLF